MILPACLVASLVASLIAALASTAPCLQDAPPAAVRDDDPRVTPVVRVVREAGPAVVNVYQEVVDESEPNRPFRRLWTGRFPSTNLGSGFIIDEEGYILTNAHVVDADGRTIQVRLNDGTSRPAEIVDVDTRNDVALIKIQAEGPFPVVRLGRSADLMVGETVIAIGNPMGNENSVSTGIVSALFRDVRLPSQGRRRGDFKDFVQTDAPINPGNSGGPLLNIKGEVVGVNFAVNNEAQGIGFAIPIDRVRRSLIDDLSDPRMHSEIVTGLRLRADPEGSGVVVVDVVPDGPADRAGLRVEDRVLSLGDRGVRWEFDVNKFLLGSEPGDSVPLLVERAQGEVRGEIRLQLELQADVSPLTYIWKRLGIRVLDHPMYEGVRVDRVDPEGPAALVPLEPGDLIDGLDDAEVDSVDELFDALVRRPSERPAVLQGFRDKVGFRVALSLAPPE